LATTTHIKFGDGLDVTDEGAGVIRVNGSGGPAGPAGATGPAGPAGPNLIDGSTPTPLTGLLKGNGTDIDVATAGTDYATPAQVGNKVDRDAVEVATARLVAVKLAAGDTQPAFRILGDGKHLWGPGGATAPDTTLYRPGFAGYLGTDGDFAAHANDTTKRVLLRWSGTAPELLFGADASLYRAGVGTVATDGIIAVQPGTSSQSIVLHTNAASKPEIALGADATLYRDGAYTVRSDGFLNLAGDPGFGNRSMLTLFFNGVGARPVEVGPPDSGGTGWRYLRVLN
jgi:hypothetical protein